MLTPSENVEIGQILHSVVATSLQRLYYTNNVSLLLWIYKNPPMDYFIVRRCKRGGGHSACKRPDFENSPILLENMNFEIFSKFIISKKQLKSR